MDIWGRPFQTLNTSVIVTCLRQMLDMNANVNFYMFHGGTNWGFQNGYTKAIRHICAMDFFIFLFFNFKRC